MLIHSDQKPFQCQYCEQTFRQKQLLKRHENIYHNPDYHPTEPREKNHNCPTCDKAFRHKGNLMRHMASHDLNNEIGTSRNINVKGEPMTDDMLEENYVVVEVINEGIEEQYEDEATDLELEEEDMGEEMETIVEESDSYTLAESMIISTTN